MLSLFAIGVDAFSVPAQPRVSVARCGAAKAMVELDGNMFLGDVLEGDHTRAMG